MAASCAHDVEAATRAAVTALCPSFRACGEPSYTETSMLLGGVLDGRAVIAKYPIDRRPFWLARARHEITVYRALPALAPLPVTVPDMVAADPMHPLIVIAALNGDPVHPHRYLTGTIHSGQLGAVLSLLARVHAWRPAIPSALPYDNDYPGQLSAVRGSEINGIEHSCAVELYTAMSGRLGVEIQHGDAHLGNVMCQPDGRLALIDLEFTAWRWPGYDLAMLWVLLGDAPGVREQLIPRIGCTAERQAAFWCAWPRYSARPPKTSLPLSWTTTTRTSHSWPARSPTARTPHEPVAGDLRLRRAARGHPRALGPRLHRPGFTGSPRPTRSWLEYSKPSTSNPATVSWRSAPTTTPHCSATGRSRRVAQPLGRARMPDEFSSLTLREHVGTRQHVADAPHEPVTRRD